MMKKKYIWLAILMVYILFIFSNSMKPADISSVDSGKALELARHLLAASGAEASWLTDHIIRKTAHFSEYTLLGAILFCCVRSCEFTGERRWFIHLTVGYAVPFLDETIQLFIKGRSGQISDVWLDCAGVAFGTLLMALLRLRKGRIEKLNVKKLSNGTGIRRKPL
jgi:Predicted integral membrane protein